MVYGPMVVAGMEAPAFQSHRLREPFERRMDHEFARGRIGFQESDASARSASSAPHDRPMNAVRSVASSCRASSKMRNS